MSKVCMYYYHFWYH